MSLFILLLIKFLFLQVIAFPYDNKECSEEEIEETNDNEGLKFPEYKCYQECFVDLETESGNFNCTSSCYPVSYDENGTPYLDNEGVVELLR